MNTPVKSATEVSIRENRALKEKYKVPENYVVREVSPPETVINDLQQLAKSAGFNQERFDKTIVSIHEQKKQQQTQLESKKQQLGDQLKVGRRLCDEKLSPRFIRHHINYPIRR